VERATPSSQPAVEESQALSERSGPTAGGADEGRTITIPIAIVSVLAVLLAAVPILLLDPKSNGGSAFFFGVGGAPMLAVAVVILLISSTISGHRRMRPAALWWLLVVPVGVVACAVPTMLANPRYFESETVGGFFGTLALLVILVAVCMLAGGLLWFFVLFPLSILFRLIVTVARGERVPPFRFVVPLLMLALTAFIVVTAMSLDDLAPGRAAGGQIIAALLGLPGSYEVAWPVGLGLVRALVGAVLVALAVRALIRPRRGDRPA
jgi:hypothetical protein